jgi:cell division protein FtsI (penicillin-binding protein 3)
MGFGQATGVQFPGEVEGVLPKKSKWRDIELATLSYGYGISVTNAQLARAYTALASKGELKSLSLVKGRHEEAIKIVDESLTQEMLELMETVVQQDAGGKRAYVPGYRVAGKTGTAFLLGAEGYEKNRYVASFVGLAPVTDPELVVSVVVFDPRKNGYYGAQVAAPVFGKIMAGSLRLLNIAPDADYAGHSLPVK